MRHKFCCIFTEKNPLMKSILKQLVMVGVAAFSIAHTASAQTSVRDLQKYLNEVRGKSYQSLPASVLDDQDNESRLLDVLVPYYSDTLRTVRQKAFYITKRIGHKSKNTEVQSRAISYLILALNEKDTGIRGSVLDGLTQFNQDLFSPAVRDSIGKTISLQSANLEVLMKLAGFLNLTKYSQQIGLIISSSNNANVKWAGKLALARMGDESATTWIVNKLKTAKVNDDFVYDVVPDLVYTRQPVIFEYLEGIVNSDDANCTSANPDSNKKMLCGYRVLEHIAPAIRDFPLSANESGDLNVSDYESALQQARSWFALNQTYALVSETY